MKFLFSRAATVGTYVRRFLAVGLVIISIIGGASLVAVSLADDAWHDLVYHWGPAWPENQVLLTSIISAESSIELYALTGNESALQPYEEARQTFSSSVFALERFTNDDETSEIAELVEEQVAVFDEWLTVIAEPVVNLRPDDPGRAQMLVQGEQSRLLTDEFRLINARTGNLIIAGVLGEDDEMDKANRLARGAVIISVGLGLLLGFGTYLRMSRSVTRPLETIQARLQAFRPGEPIRLDPQGVREVRGVTAALNQMSAENSRLTIQQRERLDRERQVAAAGHRIRFSLDLNEVLDTAVEVIGVTVGVDRVIVRAVDDQGRDAGGARWNAPGQPPLDDEPPFWTFTEEVTRELVAGELVTIRTDDETQVTPPGRTWLEDHGIVTATIAPVMAGGRLVGVVGLHWFDRGHRMRDVDVTTIQAVCRELGMALGHARLYESERSLVLKLQEVDQAKSDFISTVSHELRTPLTSIVGYVEMFKDGDLGALTDEQDEVLSVVGRNTERLQNLIEDLLTLSRIESDELDLDLVDVDIVSLVRDTLDTFAPKVTQRSQALVTHIDGPIPPITGDPSQLERVVLNLTSNAIKFTPDGGQITVELRSPDSGHIELTVSDTGMGIPEAEQEHLFTRFFRTTAARQQAIPGTGLGLAIVKGTVDRHGGTITVASTPGEGTSFVVRLPVDAQQTAPAGAPDPPGEQT